MRRLAILGVLAIASALESVAQHREPHLCNPGKVESLLQRLVWYDHWLGAGYLNEQGATPFYHTASRDSSIWYLPEAKMRFVVHENDISGRTCSATPEECMAMDGSGNSNTEFCVVRESMVEPWEPSPMTEKKQETLNALSRLMNASVLGSEPIASMDVIDFSVGDPAVFVWVVRGDAQRTTYLYQIAIGAARTPHVLTMYSKARVPPSVNSAQVGLSRISLLPK